MASSDISPDELIARFMEVTGATRDEAMEHLEAADWNIDQAVNEYANYDEDDAMEQDTYPEESSASAAAPPGSGRTLGGGSAPVSAQPPAASQPKSKGKKPDRKLKTLRDLQNESGGHGHSHDDDDDEDEKQDFFAGGEKSGLAVTNPNASSTRDMAKKIIERAGKYQPPPDDEEEKPSHFTGRGVTLGGDDAPSQVVQDPSTNQARRPPRVTRTLHLWREGFSVDDGPLMRYDDPVHARSLNMIHQGRAPLDILNVEPFQEVDLTVANRQQEDYKAPKKKYQAFSGSGQRLGSPTPAAVSSSSSSAAPAPAPAQAPPSQASSSSAPQVSVDSSQPIVRLQIRLGDGTRLQSQFNTTHTIGDVYGFVDASSTASRQRAYTLMTTFPSRELSDRSTVLSDVPELKKGGVVVQKWN